MIEKNKKMLLLLLHVALLQVFVVQTNQCPTVPDDNLTCYNDYSHNINCVWNNKYESDHKDNCTIHTKEWNTRHNACRTTKTYDVSEPELNKYTLFFHRDSIFRTSTVLCLSLKCSRWNHSVNIFYQPVCHVKLNPPEKPNINQTTVWWIPAKVRKLDLDFQMQWKKDDMSWSDPSVLKEMKQTSCDDYCAAELNANSMIQDASYVARIRVRVEIPTKSQPILSTWSGWSPTSSPVRTTQKTTAEGGVVAWVTIVAAAAPFALLLILIFTTDRTTWVYAIKLIRGPPLPNPAKSFLNDGNIKKWQSSFFTSESYLSFLKPLDIDSVEVTCAVDDITSCKQELLPLENSIRDCSQESSSSSFSNPSYSQLCPVPPVCSLTAGNLEPCAADSPYGPAGGHSQSTNPEQDVEKQKGKHVDITQLFSKADNCQPLVVISDYEKVEKFQVERDRLQSVDSGVCSEHVQELSQESLEPDSITQSFDEEPESKRQWEEGNGDHFQKLFGHSSSGDGCSKGSMEVCSDYEQVQKLQVEIPDDVSVDLDVSRDHQLSHHILSTPSTRSPSHPPSTVLLHFTPSPLNLIRPGSSLGPLALIDQTVMSNNSSLELSADGYLPVTQEQS